MKFIPRPAVLPDSEDINPAEILQKWENGDIDLICVLGPTASGKTRYAVSLAKELNRLAGRKAAEILSADSRQVYKGMDIGTGKDMEEYGEIPCHLIDIAEAGSKYNIYEYQKDFEKAYADIVSRDGIPVLCGGSGLYIEAATCGYSLPDVPPDPELRKELEQKDTESLINMLASMKSLHNKTDYDTRQRLIRALEIAVYQKDHPAASTEHLPKKTYYIGTLVSREERNARIDRRLEARLAEGMTDEIRRLLDSGIKSEDLIYYGLEYKYVTLYVVGELSYEQMKSRLAIAIHQFAKRQMTWFRGMERRNIRIHWTSV